MEQNLPVKYNQDELMSFVLFSINTENDKRIGVIKKAFPNLKGVITCAFEYSLQNENYYDDLRILVLEKAKADAHFEISIDAVQYYEKVLLSTSNTQYCHLFGIAVDKDRIIKNSLASEIELKSLPATEWLNISEIIELEDWKPALISLKRKANQQQLTVKFQPV